MSSQQAKENAPVAQAPIVIGAKKFFTEGLFAEKFKSTQVLFGKDYDADVVASALLKPATNLTLEGNAARVSGGQARVGGILTYKVNEFTVKAEGKATSKVACMAVPKNLTLAGGQDKKPATQGASASSCQNCLAVDGEVKLSIESSDFLLAGLKLAAAASSDFAAASPKVFASAQYTRGDYSGKIEEAINVRKWQESTIKASAVGSYEGFVAGGSGTLTFVGAVKDFDFGLGYSNKKAVLGAAVTESLKYLNVAGQYEIRDDIKVAVGATVPAKAPAAFSVQAGGSFQVNSKHSVELHAVSTLDIAVKYALKVSDQIKGSATVRANILNPASTLGVGASFRYEQK